MVGSTGQHHRQSQTKTGLPGLSNAISQRSTLQHIRLYADTLTLSGPFASITYQVTSTQERLKNDLAGLTRTQLPEPDGFFETYEKIIGKSGRFTVKMYAFHICLTKLLGERYRTGTELMNKGKGF